MAFTRDELLHGALAAWIVFAALLFVSTAIVLLVQTPSALWYAPLAGLLAALFGGAVFGLLVPFGALAAWAIGYGLRRLRHPGWHFGAFATLGLVLGATYVILIRGPHLLEPLNNWDLLLLPPTIAISVAVPAGWAIASWNVIHAAESQDGLLDEQDPIASESLETPT